MEKCFSTYDLPFHVLKEIGILAAKQLRDVNQEVSTSSYNVNHVKMMKKTLISSFVCKGYHSKMKIKTQFYLICFRLCFFIF